MHPNEIETDVALVRRLLDAQFPQWAALPIERIPSAGTDNAIYRLGDDLSARLPRIQAAAAQVDKEQRWLPGLAAHLPLGVPVPLAHGRPGEGYPWGWSVRPWLKGHTAAADRSADPLQVALALAHFVSALQGVDPSGGPPPGEHNFFRGVPLAARDASTRACIKELRVTLDAEKVTEAWDAALRAPAWHRGPVWVHGDLSPENLLVHEGVLSAVIDFGGLCVGDPACDLTIAWTLFTGESRAVFRAALGVDDATWARGRGWALSVALIALPYYLDTNPVIVRNARRAIQEVLADAD